MSDSTPNPGSDAALDAGCICPVLDNAHGRGVILDGRPQFWMVHGCPIHDPPTRLIPDGPVKREPMMMPPPMDY